LIRDGESSRGDCISNQMMDTIEELYGINPQKRIDKLIQATPEETKKYVVPLGLAYSGKSRRNFLVEFGKGEPCIRFSCHTDATKAQISFRKIKSFFTGGQPGDRCDVAHNSGGANDNLSGVAVGLQLANYFVENEPPCTLQVLFSTGEEGEGIFALPRKMIPLGLAGMVLSNPPMANEIVKIFQRVPNLVGLILPHVMAGGTEALFSQLPPLYAGLIGDQVQRNCDHRSPEWTVPDMVIALDMVGGNIKDYESGRAQYIVPDSTMSIGTIFTLPGLLRIYHQPELNRKLRDLLLMTTPKGFYSARPLSHLPYGASSTSTQPSVTEILKHGYRPYGSLVIVGSVGRGGEAFGRIHTGQDTPDQVSPEILESTFNAMRRFVEKGGDVKKSEIPGRPTHVLPLRGGGVVERIEYRGVPIYQIRVDGRFKDWSSESPEVAVEDAGIDFEPLDVNEFSYNGVTYSGKNALASVGLRFLANAGLGTFDRSIAGVIPAMRLGIGKSQQAGEQLAGPVYSLVNNVSAPGNIDTAAADAFRLLLLLSAITAGTYVTLKGFTELMNYSPTIVSQLERLGSYGIQQGMLRRTYE
jgi:hypothetical protein